MRFAFDLNHQSEKIKINDQRKPVGFIFHESGHCCIVRLTFIHMALVYAHLFWINHLVSVCDPSELSSETHLISYVHQRVKPWSQSFRTQDLHSKSITISQMQRGIGTSPRCIRLLDRGAQT